MKAGINKIARKLRKNQTPYEAILWRHLRNRQLDGKKFLRQYPILFDDSKKKCFFIADFYCAEHKFVIELDGTIHKNQIEQDEHRTLIINQMGINLMRIKNEELSDINVVLNKIRSNITFPSLSQREGVGG